MVAWTICAFLFLPGLLGLLDIFYFIKTPQRPVDQSNIINRIRIYWFAKKRMHEMVGLYPWLKGDEKDNLKGA